MCFDVFYNESEAICLQQLPRQGQQVLYVMERASSIMKNNNELKTEPWYTPTTFT